MEAPRAYTCTIGLLLVVALFAGMTGCSYVTHRIEDAADVVDIGLTFSAEPQFTLYTAKESLISLGYSSFDGTFVGLGGGSLGFQHHRNQCWGAVLIGNEKMAWREFDWSDPATYSHQDVGIGGMIAHRFEGTRPDYMPACIHAVHLGWVGVMANFRWWQALDFVVGFSTIDLGGDDGRKLGHWPWLAEQ